MKKLKTLVVALGALAVTGSALAIPTLIVSDGVTSTSLTSASGIISYSAAAFDSSWQVVISTALTKPALGSATSPMMDLNIQATSLSASPVHNLTITFFDTGFGPTSGSLLAQLTGHVIAGTTGQNVSYNTYYSTLNTGATTTLLTSSGSLAPPTYLSDQSGSINASLYSLDEVVTINGTPTGTAGGGYSLDASLGPVPDGGTTVLLLGAALSGLAFIRRKMA